VRRGLSKEKKQALTIAASAIEEEEDEGEYDPGVVAKTDQEIERISKAVKANFLFAHLNDQQRRKIFDVMKRVPVKKDEVVIRQGDQGDWFYVVDSGEYSVTITPPDGGAPIEILKYTTGGGTNPCFGELALMYSKPRAATVTSTTDGMLWAMDRRSFRSILMKSSTSNTIKTLRSVEVLKSLSVGQLQRLADVLTEVTFKEGDYVVTQGQVDSTFYIISDGSVKVSKKEAPSETLMELSKGQYFGERALLKHEPRAANVIATTKLKCFYVSKDSFEEVLGPLQAIIDDDRIAREKQAASKQLQLEAEGLTGVDFGSFTLIGQTVLNDPTAMVLVSFKGKEYTVKALSKAKVEAMSLQSRVLNERAILAGLSQTHNFVPQALVSLTDTSYIYWVFKVTIACALSELMEKAGALKENEAKFYIACVASGLQHLHQLDIIYRNVYPEALVVTTEGYLQLMDMSFAVKTDSGDKPRDYCGAAHYLSPEQVSGQGHDQSVDYWACGILMYEMMLESNPWLTGDAAKDSELGIYARISAHKGGSLMDTGLSEKAEIFLNGLLEPAADQRLGVRGVGPEEIRANSWMADMDWYALSNSSLTGPHASATKAVKPPPASLTDKYTGDDAWCKEFKDSSFTTK